MPRLIELCRWVLHRFPAPSSTSVGRLLRTTRFLVFWKNLGLLGALPCLDLSRGPRLPPSILKHGEEPAVRPRLDISIVTFNNPQWIDGFLQSLGRQSYPLELVTLLICDHSSDDNVLEAWKATLAKTSLRFGQVNMIRRSNHGFGAGHNFNLKSSNSPFVLIANVDIEFQEHTLNNLLAAAVSDVPAAAAWECRQVPNEHPKYYDPRTLETQWCSAAACLYRADALKDLGGFDETIFMYGEDVELSFALKSRGHGLRYVPTATIAHHSYDDNSRLQGKPHQVFGTAFSYAYLSRTYGGVAGGIRAVFFLLGSVPFRAATGQQAGGVLRGLWRGIRARSPRQPDASEFRPRFADLDYEIRRTPAWVPAPMLQAAGSRPLVSVVVRTFGERKAWAREALRTLSYQTYRNLEVVLVEDGTDIAADVVADFKSEGLPVRHFRPPKLGRASAGNVGLEEARGDLMMFLDDDDGLFADHLETLVDLAGRSDHAPLIYANAIRIFTRTVSLTPLCYEERAFAPGHGNHLPFSRAAMLRKNLVPIQTALFRRAAYEQHGGFDAGLDTLEDWNLWLRFLKSGDFVKSERVTSYYRVPDTLRHLKRRSSVLELSEDVALAVPRREARGVRNGTNTAFK